jgi:hypothetical protein
MRHIAVFSNLFIGWKIDGNKVTVYARSRFSENIDLVKKTLEALYSMTVISGQTVSVKMRDNGLAFDTEWIGFYKAERFSNFMLTGSGPSFTR